VIYQDVQSLATSEKKHQNLDLNSLKRLLLLMVDENDKSVEKMLARDDLNEAGSEEDKPSDCYLKLTFTQLDGILSLRQQLVKSSTSLQLLEVAATMQKSSQ